MNKSNYHMKRKKQNEKSTFNHIYNNRKYPILVRDFEPSKSISERFRLPKHQTRGNTIR